MFSAKRILSFIILPAILTIQAAAQDKSSAAQDSLVTKVPAEELADMIEADARALLGKPYSYGSSGPKAFDCSGFTSYVYKKYGIILGRSSRDQANDGRAVHGDLTMLQKGDIMIFGGRRSSIGHVGLFLKMDPDGKSCSFIHAARGGVQISHTSEPYYAGRFMGARRVIPDFVKNPDGENGFSDEELENLVAKPDTLTIEKGDARIVLLADGDWLLVDSEGRLSKPSADSSFVLGSNGRWKAVAKSPVTIPGTPKQTQVATPATKDSISVAPAGQTESIAAVTPDEEQQPVYHTVKKGDTLYGIANANHTTVKALCALNGIKDSAILQIGQKLRIK